MQFQRKKSCIFICVIKMDLLEYFSGQQSSLLINISVGKQRKRLSQMNIILF